MVRDMTLLALLGWLIFLLLAFVLRTVMHLITTGKSGYAGIHGRPFSLEWWGGALVVLACLGCPLACLLDYLGVLPRSPLLSAPVFVTVGVVAYAIGLGGTLWAQLVMGASWRIGVDPSARTKLVTQGPFAFVRNPIFSCMLVLALGLALLVPNLVSVLSALALLVGLEIQVRLVEEPYLRRVHGDAYLAYAQATGRFFPGLGRLQ
jgi:protein-S-isoprenylcysteine O-methyltransferase Ste14